VTIRYVTRATYEEQLQFWLNGNPEERELETWLTAHALDIKADSYDQGYGEGKDAGFEDGYAQGHEAGLAEGRKEVSDDSYNAGYEDGKEAARR
jgi:flagellar assembly protein FliH